MSKTDGNTSESIAAPDDSLSIANELINARTALGLTQVQLAEGSGVSRSAIKGYESGRNMPGARELRALCKALRVTPNQLLYGTESVTFESGSEDDQSLDAILRHTTQLGEVTHAIAALVSMLTKTEADALFVLARSLSEARHGADTTQKVVRKAMFAATIFQVATELMTATAKAGKPVDPATVAARIAAEFERKAVDGSLLA